MRHSLSQFCSSSDHSALSLSYGCLWDPTRPNIYTLYKADYCKAIANGNIVTIILDLNKYTLSYKVNDKDLGIAFKNIAVGNDLKYVLAISVPDEGTSVSLINYEIS